MANTKRRRTPKKATRRYQQNPRTLSKSFTKHCPNPTRFDNNQHNKPTFDNSGYGRNDLGSDSAEVAKLKQPSDMSSQLFYEEARNHNIQGLIKSLPSVLLGCITSSVVFVKATGNMWWFCIILPLGVLYCFDLFIASLSLIRKR